MVMTDEFEFRSQFTRDGLVCFFHPIIPTFDNIHTVLATVFSISLCQSNAGEVKNHSDLPWHPVNWYYILPLPVGANCPV